MKALLFADNLVLDFCDIIEKQASFSVSLARVTRTVVVTTIQSVTVTAVIAT